MFVNIIFHSIVHDLFEDSITDNKDIGLLLFTSFSSPLLNIGVILDNLSTF